MNAFTIGGYSRPSTGYFGPQTAYVTGVDGAKQFLKEKQGQGTHPSPDLPDHEIEYRFMREVDIEDESIARIENGRIFIK